ncbi:MAG: PadR family transcriptional regulator [Candidatus Riflebacteria bacterium]
MSAIELIILGILSGRAMNAYELVQYIDSLQIGRLIKISKPAVYKTCKRLFQAGYLNGKTTREGENPEKTIYSPNAAGKKHFLALMEHFSGNVQPFYLDFNSFLWNIDKLERKKARRMLLNLRDQLIAWREWIIKHEAEDEGRNYAQRNIVRQYRMLFIALVEWADEALRDFEKSKRL